jgi:hypothetical protein
MAIGKDYLSFDAYSIKRRIEQRLAENSDFTDQIYPGSDLSIFIDIVAYSFQTLQYYINQAGNEAMASDAQFYENINRIVKFLDYNPDGYSTAQVDTVLSGVPTTLNNTVLPPYSSVSLGRTDENGNEVTFSTVDYHFLYDDPTVAQGSVNNNITLHNGKWTLYESPFIADGIPFETFTCDNLYSENSTKSYTAFPFVHAIVERGGQFFVFKPVRNSVFLDPVDQRTYSSNDKIFELRLDEFKNVQLRFGDGIYGSRLQSGDKIYVVYLKSNGPDGTVLPRDISNLSLTTSIAGLKTNTLRNVVSEEYSNLVNSNNLTIPASIVVNNYSQSSNPQVEESVDDIRFTAPNHFRSGGRLVTTNDYSSFIRGEFFKDVIDVKVMNNFEYMRTFLRWLYNSGVVYQGDSGFYLSNDLRSRYGYQFVDSCDFNNVYAWVQMKSGYPIPKENIRRDVESRKALTGELVIFDPIISLFVPCANDPGYNISDWDPNFENYIEVELNPSTLEAPQRIKNKVNSFIISFFSTENQRLGVTVNFDSLYNALISIDGVKNIRTVYKATGSNNVIYYNGLKFAKWTPNILNGADRELVTGNYKLEEFMYPRLTESSMNNRIKIITQSAYGVNEVEY